MRKNLNGLIVRLIVIKETAKNIHYICKGDEAYSMHLLADRVAENIDDYIDACKESILGSDFYPKTSQDYMIPAINMMPQLAIGQNKENFNKLYTLIKSTLEYIDGLELDTADSNIVGNIAENLKNSKGLINLQIS